MALYLGTTKMNLYIGDSKTLLLVGISKLPEANRLLSSDGFVLVDSNGYYLVPKEDK
jgi:hypothetical protein